MRRDNSSCGPPWARSASRCRRTASCCRRPPPRGATLLQALSPIFGNDIQTEGALAFQRNWAQADASGGPFISVITGSGGVGAPVVLRMLGPGGGDVGTAAVGGPIARNL